MLSTFFRLILSFLCIFGLIAFSIQPSAAQDKKTLDSQFLRSYAETRGFMLGRPVKAKPSPDGKSVFFLAAKPRQAKQSLFIFDIGSGNVKELASPEQVLNGAQESLSAEEKARRERQRISVGGFTDFQISDDSKLLMISLSGKLYVLEKDTGQIRLLDTGENVLDPKFSPDSKYVSYVKDSDLHLLSLESGKSRKLTSGGKESLSHGLAEFVAQEELDRYSGYWWSPDSRFIAYEEADADGVEVWHIADPENPDKAPTASYYPRPGKANVKTRLAVLTIDGNTKWLDWDNEKFPYLATLRWTRNAPLTFVVLSRDQKELQIHTANPETAKTELIYSEKDPSWLNLYKDMPCWLENGNEFLWISERSGAAELELRKKDGELSRVLLTGNSGLISFVDADDKGSVYYEASLDPKEAHLYRCNLSDGKSTALTNGKGLHQANFSKSHDLFVLNENLEASMPQTSVHNVHGKMLGRLPSIAEEPDFSPNLEYVELAYPEKFQTVIIRPQNFNPALRYPVIVDVYGGPGKIKVVNSKRSYLLDQWLADQGFIVVSIDGRGTPGRGRAWERAIAGKFGSITVDDQVRALEKLAEKYPEMDRQRIGITGWSFGGYMSALALLRRPDVFKAAVAGAPVVDWLDYDSCYTERYLGLPAKEPQAYKEASLLTYASELKNPLLLVHGTTDDNVFFRHSLRLADALFRSGKDFKILPLSGLTHMVPDPVVMENLWKRIAGHFKTHLGEPS